jgi:hypothetical protein
LKVKESRRWPAATAAHLLQTQTPQIGATVEQQIRGGGDRLADWILVVSGYDLATLEGLQADELGTDSLTQHGAAPGVWAGLYCLSHTNTAGDVS